MVREIAEKRLIELRSKEEALEKDIAEQEKLNRDPEEERFTLQQFLNLSKMPLLSSNLPMLQLRTKYADLYS